MTMAGLCLLLLAMGGTPEAEIAWDGPLLPAYRGGALLPVKCDSGGAEPSWRQIPRSSALGRKRGDTLFALVASSGAPQPVKLGQLDCAQGGCRSDYVTARLYPPPGNRLVAIAPEGLLTEGTRVVKLSVARQGCRPPVPHRKGTLATCTVWQADGLLLETIVREDVQPNEVGYQLVTAHARLYDGDRPGPWVAIETDPSADVPRPVLALFDPAGAVRVLWLETVGIDGPPYTRVFLSRPTADGRIELGRGFKAGGQPCD